MQQVIDISLRVSDIGDGGVVVSAVRPVAEFAGPHYRPGNNPHAEALSRGCVDAWKNGAVGDGDEVAKRRRHDLDASLDILGKIRDGVCEGLRCVSVFVQDTAWRRMPVRS